MAKKTVTIYTDDLTGEESGEASTHNLVLDGVSYEIDLSPDSYDKLLEAVAPFIHAGRRSTRPARRDFTRRADNQDYVARVRSWARASGLEVNERGRLPKKIREAYDEAHA
ncbi:histone-like nucleoid-structuring protein Lsr2 (plasmid) [Streptomyces sp. JL4002]|uniref:histone-like nucleoid-structuring protein Lsr2 n=1 Tax=Streptomyces sp. JL4002 TaxID=3404781 RepID=UPI003B28CDC2